MCASYGLGGGRGLPDDLEPLSEPGPRELLLDWIDETGGRAAITGARARNLNPLIMGGVGGERRLELAWWWLWLDPTGPVGFSAFNSRDDKLLRSWKGPLQHRAILPATWYVEKKHLFTLPDDETFGIAAITSTVEVDGEPLITYSMVTRDAVGQAASTWPRMPLILPRELHDEWLDPGRAGEAELVKRAQQESEEISHEVIDATPPPEPEGQSTLF